MFELGTNKGTRETERRLWEKNLFGKYYDKVEKISTIIRVMIIISLYYMNIYIIDRVKYGCLNFTNHK